MVGIGCSNKGVQVSVEMPYVIIIHGVRQYLLSPSPESMVETFTVLHPNPRLKMGNGSAPLLESSGL